MKKIFLIFTLLVLGISLYAQQGLVYTFGVFSSAMANGVVVGGGEYVLTTKSAIFEITNRGMKGQIEKTYGHINPYPLFASNDTGDVYECTIAAIMDDYDLALLKLPKKIDYYYSIDPKPKKLPTGRIDNVPQGKKFTTSYSSLDKKDDKFYNQTFISKMGVLEKASFNNSYFVTDLEKPHFNMGSPLCLGNKLMGIYTNLQPVTIVSRETFEYNACEFSMANQVITYCKENNIEFNNTNDTKILDKNNFADLDIIDEIIGAMVFLTPEDILKACEKYTKDSPYILTLKGIAYENSGDKTNALKSYEKAISLNSNEVLPQIRYANLQGDKLTRLQDLGKKFPTDYRIYERLSKCYMEQKNYIGAKSQIALAMKYNPNDPILLLENAKIEKELNNQSEVVKNLQIINTICPRYEDSLDFQCEYFLSLNDLTTSEKVINYYMKVYPNSIKVQIYKGQLELKKGNLQLGNSILDTLKSQDISQEYKDKIDDIKKEYN